jgi:hypothetical protein
MSGTWRYRAGPERGGSGSTVLDEISATVYGSPSRLRRRVQRLWLVDVPAPCRSDKSPHLMFLAAPGHLPERLLGLFSLFARLYHLSFPRSTEMS